MGQLEPTAIGTMAKALRQAASEKGYTLSDTLCALMIGQMIGAEGAMPGFVTSLGGTNNIGATQVTKGWWAAHKGQSGWGAFAHKDSDPNRGAYLGWYQIMPSPLEAARSWLFGNWWGKALLTANPSDATTYATILYKGGYYGGTHAGDTAHDPTSDAGKQNVADYARDVQRAVPSTAALNGPSNDPAAVTVDASKFADLGPRQITEDLFNKAKNGGMGSAWGFLPLPATFADLQAAKGVVWADGTGGPGSSSSPSSPPSSGAGGLIWSAVAFLVGWLAGGRV